MKNNKFPTWEEAILGITDPRLKDEVYSNIVRHYVGVGARIMYGRLYGMLSPNAVLTSEKREKEGKE